MRDEAIDLCGQVDFTRTDAMPLLERDMKNRPGYAEYAAKTSIFIPWFPKN